MSSRTRHWLSPKRDRKTFRRHFPIWVGLIHRTSSTERRVSGVYARVGWHCWAWFA